MACVGVIYLTLTPVVWGSLLNPLAKIGWVSGIIFAVIGIYTSLIGGIPVPYNYGVFFVAVIILALTAISTRYQLVRKTKPEKKPKHGDFASTVEIGGKTLSTSSLYKLDDLPRPDEILKHARRSVYFVGDSLHYLVSQYAPAIEQCAGKLRLRFLIIIDDSPIGQAIVKDSDPSEVMGQNRNTVRILKEIRDRKIPGNNLDIRAREWFEIRGYKQLPFSMVLVDTEDKEHAVIQVGFYTHGSPSGSRPSALVSPKSELYEVLMKTYETAWEKGGGDRPIEYV